MGTQRWLLIQALWVTFSIRPMTDSKCTPAPLVVTLKFVCRSKIEGTSKGEWIEQISNSNRLDVTGEKPVLYPGSDDSARPHDIAHLLYTRLIEWFKKNTLHTQIKKMNIHIQYSIGYDPTAIKDLEDAFKKQFKDIGINLKKLDLSWRKST